jgi:serine/threonine protein phosphatase PrpC
MSQRRSDESGPEGRRFDLGAVQSIGETHVGRVRSVNQDAQGDWRDPKSPAHLFFIADGMGGHRGGEVASQLAVEQVGNVFGGDRTDPESLLRNAFERANSEIYERANGDFELAGMGTTGVALLLTGTPRAWVAHVGDSRAYRLRDGVLEILTGDHSVVGELVRRGQLTEEQARVHPQSNEILRAIGTQPHVEVELQQIEVRLGDRFMLCSDGLNGMLPDTEIADVLTGTTPVEAARQLIERANQAGGTDNITVQVVEIPATGQIANAAPTEAMQSQPAPGAEAAAAGSSIRWVVALILVAALLLLLFGSSGPGR